MNPHEQFYYATSMIGLLDNDETRFFGSCFFVANVSDRRILDAGNGAVMFLVTARHVVAEPLHRGVTLFVRVNRHGAAPETMPLPSDGWQFAEDGADIAVLPMPELRYERVAGGFAVPPISYQQFMISDWRNSAYDYRFGDVVRITGLWYGSTKHPQLIVRSGNIATATVGPVQFESGMLPAYLVDASVTRGMSGGPVYATHGRGWAETALLGVNYGYWPVNLDELDAAPPGGQTDGAGDAAMRQLMSRVERLNSRLAIVTPVHHLGEVLSRHPSWGRPLL